MKTYPANRAGTIFSADVTVHGAEETITLALTRAEEHARLAYTLSRAEALDFARGILRNYGEPGLTPAYRPGEVWLSDMGTVLLIVDEINTLRYEFRTKTWVSSPRVGGTGLCLHRRLASTLAEAEETGVLNAPPALPFVLDF